MRNARNDDHRTETQYTNSAHTDGAHTDDPYDGWYTPAPHPTIDRAGMIILIIIVALTIALTRLMPSQPAPQPVYIQPVDDHRVCIIVSKCN